MALLFALLLSGALAPAAPVHRCAAAAIKQARALLIFHTGAETDVTVDDTAKALAPIRNPADRRQLFDVLELLHGLRRGLEAVDLVVDLLQ